MRKKFAATIFVALSVAGAVQAQTCSPTGLPNPLQNGQAADANAVSNDLKCAGVWGLANYTGNVGIGMSVPAYKLHVMSSGAQYSTTLMLDTPATNMQAALGFGSVGSIKWQLGKQADDTFFVWDAVAGRDDLYATPNGILALMPTGGNVGIGTVSPGYTLHVHGTAYADGAAGALSDIRHKKHIESLPDGALALVSRLRPVSFLWKKPLDDGMKGKQIGFIAQEVEKVVPSIVITQNNAEHTKGLKYDELIPLLTKAIQEQQIEIEKLQKEVSLRNRQHE